MNLSYLALARVGFHNVDQFDPRVRYDVGQVDRASAAHAEEGDADCGGGRVVS